MRIMKGGTEMRDLKYGPKLRLDLVFIENHEPQELKLKYENK